MGMYALGLRPLLTPIISNNTENLIHVAFADDLANVGPYNVGALWSLPWLLRKRTEIIDNNEGRIYPNSE